MPSFNKEYANSIRSIASSVSAISSTLTLKFEKLTPVTLDAINELFIAALTHYNALRNTEAGTSPAFRTYCEQIIWACTTKFDTPAGLNDGYAFSVPTDAEYMSSRGRPRELLITKNYQNNDKEFINQSSPTSPYFFLDPDMVCPELMIAYPRYVEVGLTWLVVNGSVTYHSLVDWNGLDNSNTSLKITKTEDTSYAGVFFRSVTFRNDSQDFPENCSCCLIYKLTANMDLSVFPSAYEGHCQNSSWSVTDPYAFLSLFLAPSELASLNSSPASWSKRLCSNGATAKKHHLDIGVDSWIVGPFKGFILPGIARRHLELIEFLVFELLHTGLIPSRLLTTLPKKEVDIIYGGFSSRTQFGFQLWLAIDSAGIPIRHITSLSDIPRELANITEPAIVCFEYTNDTSRPTITRYLINTFPETECGASSLNGYVNRGSLAFFASLLVPTGFLAKLKYIAGGVLINLEYTDTESVSFKLIPESDPPDYEEVSTAITIAETTQYATLDLTYRLDTSSYAYLIDVTQISKEYDRGTVTITFTPDFGVSCVEAEVTTTTETNAASGLNFSSITVNQDITSDELKLTNTISYESMADGYFTRTYISQVTASFKVNG